MQQLGESRMWTGNCLRDSGERSSNEAQATYLARASTCVIFRAVLRVLATGPIGFPSSSLDADCCRDLAEEIDLSQIDNFVAAPAEDRFEHEQAKAVHLLEPSYQS